MDFAPFLNATFPIPEEEGPDKRLPLAEAVARFTRPGQTLYLATTHGRPMAAMYQIARRWWGRAPGFTVVALGLGTPTNVLVHGGLASRLVSTFFGDSYPTPGPNRVLARAFASKSAAFEFWTIWTLPLRLKAGALDVPFLTTKSLLGSTMEAENAAAFRRVRDPFGEGEVGAVAALKPDVTFVHAIAADRSGNAILTPPWGDGGGGVLGAREGVVVTAERIVPRSFLRRHAHLVKVPGYKVLGVCEVPYGAHPSGVANPGVPEIAAYADDYAFVEEGRAASRNEETFEKWVREWVLDLPDHEAYLGRLGKDRLWGLRGKAEGDSWIAELQGLWERIDFAAPPSPIERMVLAGGRALAERMREAGLRTILAGVGASNLSAWLAQREIKAEGGDAELMAEIGMYGYHPRAADPFIFNYRNMPTCTMLAEMETIIGMCVSGEGARAVGAIGAAQVDRAGNVNSTRLGDATLLVGSGGANDIASAAREVLVTMVMGEGGRFVEKVDYVTSPGRAVRTVVSERG
ncbi:MAG: glutaconate CoA-transferase, partial [Candidatus Methylomirabilis sp.]|nr:glutaconate CoA-transferase [Deltaproteobacteria bacterium]